MFFNLFFFLNMFCIEFELLGFSRSKCHTKELSLLDVSTGQHLQPFTGNGDVLI